MHIKSGRWVPSERWRRRLSLIEWIHKRVVCYSVCRNNNEKVGNVIISFRLLLEYVGRWLGEMNNTYMFYN